MVRLKNRDDLSDIDGRLGAHFRASALSALHSEFLDAAPDKKRAAAVLDAFYQAAGKLGTKEKEHSSERALFNQRARPEGAHALRSHLRSTEHFAALREFSGAKESLLSIDPRIAEGIIRLVAREIDDAARSSLRTGGFSPGL